MKASVLLTLIPTLPSRIVRVGVLSAVLLSVQAVWAQGPPPPPPADRTWAQTEGPAWISYRCPNGTVYFTAHLGGPRSLFSSDLTGEVPLAHDTTGGDLRWIGEGIEQRHEPERRLLTTLRGLVVGGGACVQDRMATAADSIPDRSGVWIVDTRMNPKPGRVGLAVPGGWRRDEQVEMLFVGTDAVELTSEDVDAVRSGGRLSGARPTLVLTPTGAARVAALQSRHAAQPLALIVDGRLRGEMRSRPGAAATPAIPLRGLAADEVADLRDRLQPPP